MNRDLLDKIASNLIDTMGLIDELRNAPETDLAVLAEPPVPSGLTRLVAPDGGPLSHAYSTIDPWNSDHTGLLLWHSGGRVALHDGKGQFFKILPGVRQDSRCVWSRKDHDLFYMVSGNKLQVFDVSKSWDTQPKNVETFPEYGLIDIGVGEGDISEDGEYLPMVGNGTTAFLYNLSTGSIEQRQVITGLNAAYVTADNRLLATGAAGVWLSASGRQVAYRQEHMDVGRDLDGSPIVAWLDDRNNAVTKIRLSDMHMTPLVTLDWKLATHICLPAKAGYAIVSPYAPDREDVKHARDILKVPLDGSDIEVIAEHKSDASTYEGQSHAVASGNQFLFDAREGGQNVVYLGVL